MVRPPLERPQPGGRAATSEEVTMPEPERDEYGRVCTSGAGTIPEEDRFEECDDEDDADGK